MDCRPLEVFKAFEALARERVAWVLSEFDMGGDEFLSSLRHRDDGAGLPVFRLDLSDFNGLDEVGALQNIAIDGDINNLCESLSAIGGSYLILDNANLHCNPATSLAVLQGLKELTSVLTEYCTRIKIIVRLHIRPDVAGITPIVLRALDEAECRTYVELHPDGRNISEIDVTSGAFYNHTFGVPGRIDRALKLLSYDTFENVVNGSSRQSVDDGLMLSPILTSAIEMLQQEEGLEARTYDLLTALTFFPHGERIKTVKYFKGNQRIRPGMADRLVALGLAETPESYELGTLRGEQERFIVLKPSVLQFMYRRLESELPALCEEAADVYFGRDWRLGRPKFTIIPRNTETKIGAVVEQNASVILLRLFSDALEDKECSRKELLNRINMLNRYVARLDQDDKYLFIVKFCRSALQKLDGDEFHLLVKDMRYKYARAIRMLGRYAESITEFQSLLSDQNTVERTASIYVNLAFSHQRLDDIPAAKQAAEDAIATKVKGEQFFNARSILLSISDDVGKYKRLQRLADQARRQQCFVAAHSMQLILTSQISDPTQRMHAYRKVCETANSESDTYNGYRAMINFAELAVNTNEGLSESQFRQLLNAYKFACSQRQGPLFSRAHKALWIWLNRLKQLTALHQLFRHSSLVQRLTNKLADEKEYVIKLIDYCRTEGFSNVRRSTPEELYRYFIVRAMSYSLVSVHELDRQDAPLPAISYAAS
ncbi:hypothetical protein PS870_05925 [Pseudomonas fluorescens]|uniref:Tetratricopeptide repeat protein n=2 Tax=Pseudomonas fluorescens TaxID=294 RepID=A0A5E7QAP9_PSEFL|nr:hypothetical protein PS870_05925 [Pseudomonas fluorescens]